MPPLLRGTLPFPATHVRGLARLLPGRPSVARGGARLRLYSRLVSRALSHLPPRSQSPILRFVAAGTTRTAEEIESARSGGCVAQAELLGIRDCRGAERAPHTVERNRGARGVARGRIRVLATAAGRGAAGAAGTDGRAGRRCANVRAFASNPVHHTLRWAVFIPARSGAP